MAARPTIRDVALAAGVSVSTVSRVYTSPDLFREETRRRVHEAATTLGYVPSRNAAALATGRTGNIGLIVPDLANPLFPEMVKAAQHAARRSGLAVLLGDSDDSEDDEERLVRALAKDVDGVLLFSSLLRAEQIERAVPDRTVFVNRWVEGRSCVLVDALQGMRLTTRYLSNLGHTSLLYLTGPENSWPAHDRESAIMRAAEEVGLDVEATAPNRPSYAAGTQAAERLVGGRLPTAVVCFNDVMALGLTARLLEFGIEVPRRVSVVGWGGSKVGVQTTPALSTVVMPLRELGRVAVDTLLAGVSAAPGEPPATPVTLGVEFAARATTARAAG
jgi:DNA-binding LacI/PurR family transcriptional regulator